MIRNVWSKAGLVAATAMMAASAVPARADIVTALNGAPVAVAGGYLYTYEVQLSGGQLDGTSNGVPLQFGTVYDFGAMIGGVTNVTGQLANFTFTFANTSSQALNTNVPDDPALTNIRFTYNGANDVYVIDQSYTPSSSPGTATGIIAGNDNLGTFTVESPYARTSAVSTYDGQSYKGTNDTLEGNNGSLAVPDQPTAVPEPASMALLGSAMLGAGLFRRRRRPGTELTAAPTDGSV